MLTNKLIDWDEFRKYIEEKINFQVTLKTAQQFDNEAEQLITDLKQTA